MARVGRGKLGEAGRVEVESIGIVSTHINNLGIGGLASRCYLDTSTAEVGIGPVLVAESRGIEVVGKSVSGSELTGTLLDVHAAIRGPAVQALAKGWWCRVLRRSTTVAGDGRGRGDVDGGGRCCASGPASAKGTGGDGGRLELDGGGCSGS